MTNTLRKKVLIRIGFLLLVTVVALLLLNFYSLRVFQNGEIDRRVNAIVELIQESTFPISDRVLDDMSRLSAAEFAAFRDGKLFAGSAGVPWSAFPESSFDSDPGETGVQVVDSDGRKFRHAMTTVRREPPGSDPDAIHIFVDEKTVQELYRSSVLTSVLVALAVLGIAWLVGGSLVASLTRPLSHLQKQVEQIAAGNLEQLDAVDTGDEVALLRDSVEVMVNRLRKTERYRTMVQMGSALAHNIRNSATGCQMALELIDGDQLETGTGESNSFQQNLEVARRQNRMTSTYVDKFMRFFRSGESAAGLPAQMPAAELDMVEIVDEVAGLLRPMATHLKVNLDVETTGVPLHARLQRDDAIQLVMNLVQNAIEAASSRMEAERPLVKVVLENSSGGTFRLRVLDSGDGPSGEIVDTMFEPLVSGKPEGIGIGLSLVHSIATDAGGSVVFQRIVQQRTDRYQQDDQHPYEQHRNELTEFCVTLPVAGAEPPNNGTG